MDEWQLELSVNQGRVVVDHPNSWEFIGFLVLVEGLHIFLILFGLFASNVKMIFFSSPTFFFSCYFAIFLIHHYILSHLFLSIYFSSMGFLFFSTYHLQSIILSCLNYFPFYVVLYICFIVLI
jgi:hypothetical protein